MIDKKTKTLIQRAIDDELSEQETEGLQAILSQDPEAMNLHEDLTHVAAALRQVEAADPPDQMKKIIMNSIRARQVQTSQPPKTFRGFAETIRQAIGVRSALAFSTGLAFGLLLYAVFINKLVNPTALNHSDLTGTMIITEQAEKVKSVEALEINLEQVQGTVVVKCVGNLTLAEIDLSATEASKLVAKFDNSSLDFAGFRRLDNSQGRVDITEDEIRIGGTSGRSHYLLVFESRDAGVSNLAFLIYAADLLYENAVTVCTN